MDHKYWNEYYKKNKAPIEPSNFAVEVFKYLEEGKELLELGCGNGRDSLHFAKKHIRVTAMDQSESAINILQENNKNKKNIKFIIDDFVNSKIYYNENYEYIYSRFTLHSITKEEQDILFDKVYMALNNKGKFFIEVRSINDEIYGKGEKVGDDEYIYNSHYRRFLKIEDLVDDLKRGGFNIIFANESDSYAVYKDERPYVIRIIAQKK